MGLYSPPTADDINKLTSAADKLPGTPVPPGFPGSDYGRDQMQQAAQANVNGQTAKGAGIAARAALTTPLVAAGETGVAGLNAIGNGVKALAVPTANFLQGFTGYDSAPSAPVPPTKAQAAAGQGAAKALEASTFGQNDRGAGFDGSRPGPGNPPGAKVSADNVSDWNSFVERQLSSIAGYPAGPVLQQPLPGAGKAAGEAVLRSGSGPVRLNQGYGTEILASGASDGTGQSGNGRPGEIGKRNSFSGVGQGGMPEGAAGVFGPSGLPPGAAGAAGGAAASPFDQAQAQTQQWMQMAQQALARGDGIGARRIASAAAHFAQQFGTMAQHPYNMQMADVAQQHATVAKGQLSLQAMEKQPGMAMDQATLDAIIKGDEAGAGRKRRVYAGNPAYPVTSVQAGTYGLNPNVPPGSPGSAPFYMPTPEQWRGGK